MKTEILGGSVVFSFGASHYPWDGDPEKYIIQIAGKIMVWARGDNPDVKAGTIQMKLLKLRDALRDGVTLFHVLDCYNIEELYPALFEKDGVFLPDLDLEAPYGDLLLIESVELKTRFGKTDLRNQAIETAIATFSADVVLVTKTVLGLEDTARLDLGYDDLLFEDYLIRDNFVKYT